MTGRIKLLGIGSSSGVIESENGARLYFDAGAVLAYDVANLSVGQLVTFDSENGIGRKAVNICVQRPHSTVPAEKKRKESMLRYVGFDQTKAIRTYRFERTSFGEDTESFVVTTDVTLFTKYHIGIQEGPSLCMRLLAVGLDDTAITPPERALTEQDIITHLASKPAPSPRPHHKRVPRPAVVSQTA